jgi:hypothetical protein
MSDTRDSEIRAIEGDPSAGNSHEAATPGSRGPYWLARPAAWGAPTGRVEAREAVLEGAHQLHPHPVGRVHRRRNRHAPDSGTHAANDCDRADLVTEGASGERVCSRRGRAAVARCRERVRY